MKTRNIVALVLSAACAAVANGEITAPTAMPIQRTLNTLEKSTAANPARVRMLFYGQSIVAQGWHTNIVRQLKERYPTAILEVENRAIGGFTSPDLIRTAESDLYPFYPDIQNSNESHQTKTHPFPLFPTWVSNSICTT